MNAQHSNKSYHHYTPPIWFERATEVMGSIDLDPCTDGFAQYRPRTRLHREGEITPWFGNVFCNPPGKRGLPRKFFERCVQHWKEGNQVIYLAYSIEQLGWIQDFNPSMYICIPRKRIAFLNKKGDPQRSPTHANAFIYLGDNPNGFYRNFPGMHLSRSI